MRLRTARRTRLGLAAAVGATLSGCIHLEPRSLADQRLALVSDERRWGNWRTRWRLEGGVDQPAAMDPAQVLSRADLVVGDHVSALAQSLEGARPWRLVLRIDLRWADPPSEPGPWSGDYPRAGWRQAGAGE